jgi:hypothetical protein
MARIFENKSQLNYYRRMLFNLKKLHYVVIFSSKSLKDSI